MCWALGLGNVSCSKTVVGVVVCKTWVPPRTAAEMVVSNARNTDSLGKRTPHSGSGDRTRAEPSTVFFFFQFYLCIFFVVSGIRILGPVGKKLAVLAGG